MLLEHEDSQIEFVNLNGCGDKALTYALDLLNDSRLTGIYSEDSLIRCDHEMECDGKSVQKKTYYESNDGVIQ
jgi:hypothetical protein